MLDAKIAEIEVEIKACEEDIKQVAHKAEVCTDADDRSYLRRKEEQLRTKEEQLRREKEQLRDMLMQKGREPQVKPLYHMCKHPHLGCKVSCFLLLVTSCPTI